MSSAQRLFFALALVLFALSEAMLIWSVVGNNKLSVPFYVACLLPVVAAMPLMLGLLYHGMMKRLVTRSKSNQVDWPLVRFLGALLIAIYESSIVVLFLFLLR